MTKQINTDTINKRYAERMIKEHKMLINCLDGEFYEEAAKLRDKINEDLEATAQFNSAMSGTKIDKCRKMLQDNNQYIFDELNKTKK